jgi:hypothetical protein
MNQEEKFELIGGRMRERDVVKTSLIICQKLGTDFH